jgi:peroxiredoxin
MRSKLASLIAIGALLVALPALAKVKVGDVAPDFTLKNMNGKEFKLSTYKDKKPVVLVIWQSACSSCQQEMVLVNEVAGRGDKFELVTINVDVRSARPGWKENIDKFFEEKKLKLEVLVDPTYSVGQTYGIGATPSTILITKEGTVGDIITGFTPGADDSDLSKAITGIK